MALLFDLFAYHERIKNQNVTFLWPLSHSLVTKRGTQTYGWCFHWLTIFQVIYSSRFCFCCFFETAMTFNKMCVCAFFWKPSMLLFLALCFLPLSSREIHLHSTVLLPMVCMNICYRHHCSDTHKFYSIVGDVVCSHIPMKIL